MNRVQPVPAARRVAWPGPQLWAAVGAGVMLTSAMPPVQGTGVLAPLALALFFHLLRIAARPVRIAWGFSLAHQATLLYWMFFLDPAKSIPTRALVPIQAIATIAYAAVFAVLAGWIASLVRRRHGPLTMLAVLPAIWTGTELLRSVGELGFPWCLSGAAWLDTPVMPLFAAAGEVGLGAATSLTAAAIAALFGGRSSTRAGLAVAAVGAWAGLLGLTALDGADAPLPETWRREPLALAVAQADVSLADKWDDAKIDSTTVPYTTLTRQAAAAGAELVVWAETAVPAYLRFDRELVTWVRDLARETHVPIFLGFPDVKMEIGRGTLRYNSSGLFNAYGSLLAQYAKHHLLPIGETMPFQRLLPFLGKIDVGQAEWTPGDPPGPIILQTDAGDFPFAVLICYEAIFGDLARQAVRRGAGCLVNVTNDGWFGNTAGPVQHAALARIRAVECGVPLVRCANNGVSYICGPDGRTRAALGLHRRGILLEPVTLSAPATPFVRHGAWPALGALGAMTVVLVVLARRDDRRRRP